MRADNRYSRSLIEKFINNDPQYNYGGFIPPVIAGGDDPTPTNGMIYRFDASKKSNFTLRSSGGVFYVEGWKDISPKKNNLTQSDITRQPIWENDGFGSYQVRFDGTNDFLQKTGISNIPSGITAYTEFMVFKVNSYSQNFSIDSTNGDSDSFFFTSPKRLFPLYYPGARFDNIDTWSKQPNFLCWCRKGTSVLSMNGELNDLAQSGVIFDSWSPEPAITNITLGKSFTGTENFPGSLREVIVYDRLLSTIEISTIVSYLKSKWNYSSW